MNKGRQLEVDMAKVLAIFTMILVHQLEMIWNELTMASWLVRLIEFAGGPLSAPLFTVAMGIGMAYAGRQDSASFAKRGVKLVAMGYLLNFLRSGILSPVAWLVFGDTRYLLDAALGFLYLDILQFAGVAFLLMALLKRLRANDGAVLGVAVAMLAVATFVRPVVADSPVLAGLLGYLFYQTTVTAFPLFSWFIFPAVGYIWGRRLLRTQNKTRLYTWLLAGSALFLALYSWLLLATGQGVEPLYFDLDTYYRQSLVSAPWMLSIAGVVYGGLYFLSRWMQGAATRRHIQFLSREVTTIYFAQWLLITWPHLFWWQWMQLNTGGYLALVAGVSAASVGAAYLLARRRARRTGM